MCFGSVCCLFVLHSCFLVGGVWGWGGWGGGGVGKQFANVLWWLWGYALPVETTSWGCWVQQLQKMKTKLLEIQSYQTVSKMSPFVKSEVGMLLFNFFACCLEFWSSQVVVVFSSFLPPAVVVFSLCLLILCAHKLWFVLLSVSQWIWFWCMISWQLRWMSC